jgi:hypothetical protein
VTAGMVKSVLTAHLETAANFPALTFDFGDHSAIRNAFLLGS